MMLARAVLLILASSVMAGGLPPDDEGRRLKSGERSIEQWKRVERAWERLNK